MSLEDISGDQLQPEDTLDDRGVADVLDEGYSPPDRQPHDLDPDADHETLDQRLADEEPEVWAGDPAPDVPIADDEHDYAGGEVGSTRSGRLSSPSAGPDDQLSDDPMNDLWASDRGIDGAGASAEEAAMHTIEDEE